MDFLKNQIARIRQQLSGLSASQKMLAGSLAVIMIMTLYGWGLFAGQAEMEALLNQTLTTDEMGLIQRHLASNAIKYRVVGDRIQVPSDRKYEVLAALGYADLLPRDTRNGFDEIASKISIFAPRSQQDAILNNAKQSVLAEVMRRMPGVRNAVVVIDPTRERGPNAVEPSAMVNLTLRSNDRPDRRLVNAAADIVAGAVANMKRDRVKVVINGQSYRVQSLDDTGATASGDEYLDQVQRGEQYYREKIIREQLSHIEGAQVSVSVKPNLGRKETVTHKFDPKTVKATPVSEESLTEDTKSSQKPTGEPGIVSNSPLALGESATGDSSSGTTEKTKTDYMVDSEKTDVKSWDPGGNVDVTGASVFIPRSYFNQVYKTRTRSTTDADDAALKPIIEAELASLKPGIKKCLGLTTDDALHMDAYTDVAPLALAAPQASSASVSLLLTDHAKELALGALAVVSLFMMVTMVKKNSPAPVVAAPPPVKASLLSHTEEAVGEAAESNAVLDGMELDEDAVKSQQMVQQVSSLVGEDPEAAAAMVKRWMDRT
jgi:flagellar biosynthesis/type III secretory pathway M-ring protein FliF/YscJ